jgi:hypothetical protein
VEQSVSKGLDEVTPKQHTDTNYLSLAWYFQQNKDNYNSASPEKGPHSDVMPEQKTPIVSGEQLPASDPTLALPNLIRA